MKSFSRGLMLAAAPLVLLLAGPALAASGFALNKCEFPQLAANDTYNYFTDGNELDTENFEDGDCEKLCKQVKKICDKNVANRVSCYKTDDQFWFGLQTALCDVNNSDKEDRKNCKNVVKALKESSKDSVKSADEEGKQNCENNFGSDSSCVNDCEDGTFNDD